MTFFPTISIDSGDATINGVFTARDEVGQYYHASGGSSLYSNATTMIEIPKLNQTAKNGQVVRRVSLGSTADHVPLAQPSLLRVSVDVVGVPGREGEAGYLRNYLRVLTSMLDAEAEMDKFLRGGR